VQTQQASPPLALRQWHASLDELSLCPQVPQDA